MSTSRAFARRAATALALSTATLAQASVVFNSWTSVNPSAGNHVLTVTDTGTSFSWHLTITPWNAEALALFVDFGNATMPGSVNISNSSGLVSLVATDTTSNSCGTGCNLNGLALPSLGGDDWEVVFRFGTAGFEGLQTFSWTTPDFGLGESDLRLAAVRAQQLCGSGSLLPNGLAGCGGSDKAYAWPSADVAPPPVFSSPPSSGSSGSLPEPGTLLLLGAAVGLSTAQRAMRRRKKTS